MLGALVRAALACRDVALALETPFISGKDSLNNEFKYPTKHYGDVRIAIPHTLLISALGQIEDVRQCVTMDFKSPESRVYIVGVTKEELGGSHYFAVSPGIEQGEPAGQVPILDASVARQTYLALHRAITSGCIAACHDLSEGGLAVAAAEMAFAGGFGAELDAALCPTSESLYDAALLFSESTSRFLVEAPESGAEAFEQIMAEIPHACIGRRPPRRCCASTSKIVNSSNATWRRSRMPGKRRYGIGFSNK